MNVVVALRRIALVSIAIRRECDVSDLILDEIRHAKRRVPVLPKSARNRPLEAVDVQLDLVLMLRDRYQPTIGSQTIPIWVSTLKSMTYGQVAAESPRVLVLRNQPGF